MKTRHRHLGAPFDHCSANLARSFRVRRLDRGQGRGSCGRHDVPSSAGQHPALALQVVTADGKVLAVFRQAEVGGYSIEA